VFVSFDPVLFLAWLLLSSLIPGAALSLALFRKHEGFGLVEKICIGFALGFVLLPLVPFLLYFLAGVKFTHDIAMLAVGLLYLVALAAVFITKTYEDFMPKEMKVRLSPELLIPAALIILLILTYLVRISSYSPIFQELDPYYYTYAATQLLSSGENPFGDSTAWYPDLNLNHRAVPMLSYLEAEWYTLYTGGGAYDNMLLADIASMYPPVAAVLSVFFIYLLVSVATKREWGLAAAGIASFVPVFVFKLAAGEQEIQPYAFFALMFFYAMYLLSVKRRDLRMPTAKDMNMGKDVLFPILAGFAFAALAMGSASQILAVVSLILFILVQAILVFLRDKDESELKHILLSNSIIFIIGPLVASAIIKPLYGAGAISPSIAVAFAMPIAFAAVLYGIKKAVPDRMTGVAILAAMMIIGLAIFVATPLGDYVKNLGKAGFEIAKYNAPLDRTIAEQGNAATTFGGQMGFIASNYFFPASIDSPSNAMNIIMYVLLLPFTFIVNVILAAFVALANLFLGTDVALGEKDVSFMQFWVFLFFMACAYSAFRFMKKEDEGLFIFFLAIVLPPLVVGLIKAKYTIYSGVLLAVAIGFTLGMLGSIIVSISKFLKQEALGKFAYSVPVVIAVLLVLLQFVYQGFAPSLIWGSTQTLYQNDPAALAPKFSQFCNQSGDPEVCAAAADPMGYANRGTNYQYSSKLCMLSLFSDYSILTYMYDSNSSNDALIPSYAATSASFRCQRLSDYWIDSMEWIKNNTEPGARITSWWDYGHWINYFGERNAVIRNEHASHEMIGDVAHGYLDATPEELKAWMVAHGSKYALFDMELVSGGGSLGGKYGALNYLSCARDNLTSVANSPGESSCEADHLWETVLVSGNPCTISSLTGKTGLTAYKVYAGQTYLPYYPNDCIAPTDARILSYCRDYIRVEPVYCVANTTLVTGDTTFTTYYLNETYPNGDLKLNKALLQLPFQLPTSVHLGQATGVTLFYTDDTVWLENGLPVSGYSDRKGKFYDSALYRAIFLNNLPGFTEVYSSPSGAVKIYKIAE
jgi:asparagine N-glycosylation enzyme membrane subunit Stt3